MSTKRYRIFLTFDSSGPSRLRLRLFPNHQPRFFAANIPLPIISFDLLLFRKSMSFVESHSVFVENGNVNNQRQLRR